ncbi:DNA translocase FtsK [Dehalobacter sp. DCM]|uniref:DNA translocase FtsK n=1 Tax=Dehalobacter sp. DCM TaxID=2907827 RepID=UPI0030812137|nr:DNA translocase FtsK [Dehalobacter sp. DCM]
MRLFGKIILKILSLLYLAMFVISILGYFDLESHSVTFFSFFKELFGVYSLIIPAICLIFTFICWHFSKTRKYETELLDDDDDDDDDDVDDDQGIRRKKSPAMKKERVAKREEMLRSKIQKERLQKPVSHTERKNLQLDDSFSSYFNQELSVFDYDRISSGDSQLEHLGTNFSTYFGEGKKSFYLSENTVSIQGFKEYFKDGGRTSEANPKDCRGASTALTTVKPDQSYRLDVATQRTTVQYKEDYEKARLENYQKYQAARFGQDHIPAKQKATDEPQNNRIDNGAIPRESANSWILPHIDLLKNREKAAIDNEKTNPHHLEDILSTFGVNAKVINTSVGPLITRYELSPAPGTKISRIVNLSDDIALAMASRDIRIEAPIPGKAAVGVEVPRQNASTVFFRDVIGSDLFDDTTGKLNIALGKDIAGQPMVGELRKMPHLLVAGATGSGKSIFINCLLNSLLFFYTPDDVKLLLVDPKMVELNLYNGIPHLLTPVVTDSKKASKYLKYIVREMEDRYELFAANGVRDIDHYNRMMDTPLPFIVVIIDELADLMMVAANEIEEAICRIAQMARAAGIHLVIATQRPSVNVITGLIKANIPSRISFAVSSQIDSRTILDTGGAEKLLGKGDMLYSPIGLNKPQRVHGCFIDEHETKRVIEHWRRQGTSGTIPEDALESETAAAEKNSEDFDERFVEAGELVISTGIASTSYLQRRMKVGYSRAARLMDMLEEAGVVSSSDGNKPRDILMSIDDFIAYIS